MCDGTSRRVQNGVGEGGRDGRLCFITTARRVSSSRPNAFAARLNRGQSSFLLHRHRVFPMVGGDPSAEGVVHATGFRIVSAFAARPRWVWRLDGANMLRLCRPTRGPARQHCYLLGEWSERHRWIPAARPSLYECVGRSGPPSPRHSGHVHGCERWRCRRFSHNPVN